MSIAALRACCSVNREVGRSQSGLLTPTGVHSRECPGNRGRYNCNFTRGGGTPFHNASPTFFCSNVYGNANGDWVGGLAGQLGVNGNISADPRYCDPEGQQRFVAVDSPCLPANNDCQELIGAFADDCPGESMAILAPDGSGHFATIQEAIDTFGGDSLVLRSGVYSGPGNTDINFHGRAMKIVSIEQDPSTCTILCGGSPESPSRGIILQSGEPAEARLEGVSIIGGWAEEGGAIQLSNGASPTIRNCRLTSNAAGSGGAVHMSGGAAPRFERTLIAGNEASLAGAVHIDNAAPQFIGCTIADNSSPAAGIFANAATLSLENTIVAFNEPGASILSFGSTASMACNDIYGNEGGDYVGAFTGALGSNGNIAVDPLFCRGEPGDYGLVPWSICLPEGDLNPCGELIGAYGEGADCDLVAAEELPKAVLALKPNYPNPFNPTTEITFVLPEAATVDLVIFDLAGRRVRSLAAGAEFEAGSYSVCWDGKSGEGQSLPSGAYLCRLYSGASVATRKLILLK